MREVKDYMGYREIPEVLRKKIRDYFERKFCGKVFNEDHILNSLSEPLREVRYTRIHRSRLTTNIPPSLASRGIRQLLKVLAGKHLSFHFSW